LSDDPYRSLVDELARRGVRLRDKSSAWHQRALHALLSVVTLGAWRRYLGDYITTIGRTIYLPAGFHQRPVEERVIALLHERVHVEQFQRYGVLPMVIAYLLLPLPFGLAWCRMALEREAYAETVRATYRLCGRGGTDRLRAHVIGQFTGGAYGWMWPFPRAVARWYDGLVARLETE
jgi:hypothetical protein